MASDSDDFDVNPLKPVKLDCAAADAAADKLSDAAEGTFASGKDEEKEAEAGNETLKEQQVAQERQVAQEQQVAQAGTSPKDIVLLKAELAKANAGILQVNTAIAALTTQIQELSKLFEARILYTDHENMIINNMHKELQLYKDDMYSKLTRPILLDIIEVKDSIQRMAKNCRAKPEGGQAIPVDTFAGFAEYDLQDLLEKNGVEVYSSKPGDAFVPICQKAVKKVITEDETLHGRIAETLSDGYRMKEKVIAPEKVYVYIYKAPEAE